MPTRINPNYCVSCNKWEWNKPLEEYGAYYYHKACLQKLLTALANAAPPDPFMFQRLNRAFNASMRKGRIK